MREICSDQAWLQAKTGLNKYVGTFLCEWTTGDGISGGTLMNFGILARNLKFAMKTQLFTSQDVN